MPVIISRLRYLLTTVYIHYIIPQLAGNGGIPLIFAVKVETYVISSLTHVQAKRDKRACPKQKLLLFVIYIYFSNQIFPIQHKTAIDRGRFIAEYLPSSQDMPSPAPWQTGGRS